jgi:hypothetical protein
MRKVPSVAIVAASLDILGGQGVQARSLVDALRADGRRATLLAINPRFPRGFRWLRRLPYLRTVVNQMLYVPGLARLAACFPPRMPRSSWRPCPPCSSRGC